MEKTSVSSGVNTLELPFPKFKSGKVREVFSVGDQLLIVSTDRISAFDYVLPSLIPDKGRVLNRLSAFWFQETSQWIPNHIVCDTPHELEEFHPYADLLRDRSVLTRKLDVYPIEAIVRAYIVGSGWKSYCESGTICGISLPRGLKFGDPLPEPIFTPTTKAETGHDENITFSEMMNRIGEEDARRIRDHALELYSHGSRIAAEKGIVIADTKFEFGLDKNGVITLVDEIFTPDSSRFWRRQDYVEFHGKGKEPPAYDKQFVRNFLLSSKWDRNSIPPALPAEVVGKTREKYFEIHKILTGKEL